MTSILPDLSVHALLNHTLTCFLLPALSLSLSLYDVTTVIIHTGAMLFSLFSRHGI